ncbi:hypothetical protein PQQ75_04145 [Paraburkholderia aspalathi]|uniref:hypothetical protein n=1 Tax=Paraburkholderia aspalathi TaxID=1324617 RepID=UPI0038BD64E5
MILLSSTYSFVLDLLKTSGSYLVALASLFVTYKQVRAGHKKDLSIEELRQDADRSKATAAKRSALVMEIVTKITAVENALARHSGVFRRRDIADDADVTDAVMEEARAAFVEVNATVDACIGASVLVHLLGDTKIAAQFEIFLQSLFTFQKYANPDKTMDRFDLMDWSEKVKKQKKAVLTALGAIYLDAPA